MSSLHQLNPKADLLRREQAVSANVTAARGLQDILASNLGPKGTQKMLVGGAGQIKITKDGNVLLKEMHIQHPVASVIARAATAQDVVTGDGSTSTVLLIGEIMKLAEREIQEDLHPRVLSEGIELAREAAMECLEKFARPVAQPWKDRELLTNVARSSLRTKLEPKLADRLTEIVVDSILCILGKEEDVVKGTVPTADDERQIALDLFMVEVLPMKQGLSAETQFIKGMVMDHGCRHPDMPSSLKNCYVLTCNVSLEYEKTEVNSAFFYSSAEQRARLADAERRFTDMKVQAIIDLKRRVCTPENKRNFVVFNQKGIDPPSLDMLAREGIMALRRVKRRNMERLTLCCGGNPMNAVEDLKESDLGFAEHVWEIAMGDEKYTFVEGCHEAKSCCILVKAPTDYALEQMKDAIRDGLRAVRNVILERTLCPGAGSFEIACSEWLESKAREIESTPNNEKRAIGVRVLADAILVIVHALAKNAGLDTRAVTLKCRSKYRQLLDARDNASGPLPDVGLDLRTGEPITPSATGVWDSVQVKRQSITLATTLTTQLLLVDEIIKAGKQMGRQ